MTQLIKNNRYAFLIRLHLMSSMWLSKQFQLLQIDLLSNDLSIKHLIKIVLFENEW